MMARWSATIRHAAPATLLLTLAACTTVGPDYRIPAQAVIERPAAALPFASAQEVPFSGAPLPPHWWRLFHDSTLDDLISQAFKANTSLRVAAANLARARALLDETQAARQPAVSLNAAPAFGRASAAAKGLSTTLPTLASYEAGIGVSYQSDVYGRIARAVEAAGADAQAAQAAYDLTRVTVAADTARAYADACSSGRQLAMARRSVELQAQFTRSTEQRVRAGRGTALDTSRARSQLAQLQAALPPLQAQRRTALQRLAVLTGELPSRLPAAAARCDQPPRLGSNSPIPVGDGAALLQRRPDIRQAERALAGATALIGVATADLYPTISLGLSAGGSGPLSGFGSGNSFHWSLGPLISWSLPSTGTARARIAQAQAGSDAALARFDAAVLNALRETESALTVYARELDRNAALKEASLQSALASQQAASLTRHGRGDFLTSLDAERTLAAADSALAASDAQLTSDQLALFLALGGGWETR